MKRYDVNSLKVLLSLFEAPEENRVVSLGEKLGLKKYDVSKKLSALAEDGLVDKSDIRSIKLTEQGREFAENFSLKLGQVMQHLGYEGMDYDNTLYNAMQIVMHCNEAYFEKFQKPMTEIIRLKQLMSDKPSFSGAELAQRMSPGTYTFPFVIYREKVKHHNNISMANKGFENPCEVISDGSGGRVVLRVKEMEEHSGATGKLLSGRVMKLCYFDGKNYVSAYDGGLFVSIPLTAFSFVNMASHDSFNNILHGSVELKVQCSVGVVHMPESSCILTVFLH